eukprot:2232694-Rhodomonas_salina.1
MLTCDLAGRRADGGGERRRGDAAAVREGDVQGARAVHCPPGLVSRALHRAVPLHRCVLARAHPHRRLRNHPALAPRRRDFHLAARDA